MATSCTITGLRNGRTYKVRVRATNTQGTSKNSSFAQVEPGLPGEPTGVTAESEDGAVLVSWTAVADDGFPISNYNVVATPGPYGCNAAASTSCTVSSLTNGTTYTFTVSASNAKGTGATSDPSAPATPATVPDPPTNVSAVPDGSDDPGVLVVSFTPGFDEGSAIIANGDTVTITDQTNPSEPNNGLTVAGSDSPITVTGLTSGDTYSFAVTATNGIGTGASSSPSTGVPSP